MEVPSKSSIDLKKHRRFKPPHDSFGGKEGEMARKGRGEREGKIEARRRDEEQKEKESFLSSASRSEAEIIFSQPLWSLKDERRDFST